MSKRIAKPKFEPGQLVTLHFTGTRDEPYSYPAIMRENIDHSCSPLADMWSVQIIIDGLPGRTFGFSGKAITARAA